MLSRLLSYLIFWLMMIIMTVSSTVFVIFVFFPFVVLKAIWLAVSGRMGEATGPKGGKAEKASRA